MTEQKSLSERCDLFDNGGEGECGGPLFDDPQPEGVDLRVCAFHTLMNRNLWMREANEAAAERDRLREALAPAIGLAVEYMRAYGFDDEEIEKAIGPSRYALSRSARAAETQNPTKGVAEEEK